MKKNNMPKDKYKVSSDHPVLGIDAIEKANKRSEERKKGIKCPVCKSSHIDIRYSFTSEYINIACKECGEFTEDKTRPVTQEMINEDMINYGKYRRVVGKQIKKIQSNG